MCLSLFFSFFLSLARSLSILFIFSKNSFCFCCFIFLFSVPLISALFPHPLLLVSCVFILFHTHMALDLASGNFFKWWLYHFHLTLLVIEYFLAEQDVCVSSCTYPASAWNTPFFRKLVLVWVLHNYSFPSLRLGTYLPQRIMLFAFLQLSAEQQRYPVHAFIFYILPYFKNRMFSCSVCVGIKVFKYTQILVLSPWSRLEL